MISPAAAEGSVPSGPMLAGRSWHVTERPMSGIAASAPAGVAGLSTGACTSLRRPSGSAAFPMPVSWAGSSACGRPPPRWSTSAMKGRPTGPCANSLVPSSTGWTRSLSRPASRAWTCRGAGRGQSPAGEAGWTWPGSLRGCRVALPRGSQDDQRPAAATCAVAGSPRGSPDAGSSVDPAGAASLAGRAVAVMAVALPAAGDPLGPRLSAVLRVRPAGLCPCLLQTALASQG